MTEDEMVGGHHRLNGHEFGQSPGDGKGLRSLACCSPRGHKGSDTTEQQQDSRPLGSGVLEKVVGFYLVN